MVLRAMLAAAVTAASFIPAAGQSSGAGPRPCSPIGLEGALKAEPPMARHDYALRLADCLGHPDPSIRDRLAFEELSRMMRAGELAASTMTQLRRELLARALSPAGTATLRSFAALTLSEIARTDRIKPWMTAAERDEMVSGAASFLSGITNYAAFSDISGFVHAVAHGADFAMQLALNPAVTKTELDRLLSAISAQVAPKDTGVAYWAGEPDRLARAVVVIAQRKLHSDAEWKAWFDRVMNPEPLSAWDKAFSSEAGIRKHHNVRAFLLSVLATAMTTDDPGVKQLVSPTRDSLKFVP